MLATIGLCVACLSIPEVRVCLVRPNGLGAQKQKDPDAVDFISSAMCSSLNSYNSPGANHGCIPVQDGFLKQEVKTGRESRKRCSKNHVSKAALPTPKSHTSHPFSVPGVIARKYSRPINSAMDVRVPCSASKRSKRGVKARAFNAAWKKPVWMIGKVFRRYTRSW